MSDNMKRFINLFVPVSTCNLRCPYCYISQEGKFKDALPKFEYSASQIGKALSKERLGGTCHLNICGGGETLLPPEITAIIEELLKQGHYIMVVTNGTIKKRFDEILQIDSELLKHLGFKFSFHYLELKRLGLMSLFLSNVEKVKAAGCSYSIEMTPYDDLIPYISEIKEFCLNKFGAWPHITVARNSAVKEKPILTKLTRQEYLETWSVFDSDLFKFKMTTFNEKRTEYCYAGDWSLWVDLGTGIANQCYSSKFSQNIFENPDKKIDFLAVGKSCNVPHCHNSHALLTLGTIPEMDTPYYSMMRDRVTNNGEHWLNKEMRTFLSQKLCDKNELYTSSRKITNFGVSEIKRVKRLFNKIGV